MTSIRPAPEHLLARHLRQRIADGAFLLVTRAAAALTLLVLLGIILSLVVGASESIQKFGFGFLVSSEWNPPKEQFGALVPIYGTIATSLIALAIAVPVSFGIAVFQSRLEGRRSAARNRAP